jgi:hypothetical protein
MQTSLGRIVWIGVLARWRRGEGGMTRRSRASEVIGRDGVDDIANENDLQ